MDNKFYVYEWFNVETEEVFYVGKGCKKRYLEKNHRNKDFLDYINNNQVSSRIVKYFNDENEAYKYEKELTDKYREEKGWCTCNLIDGGYGGYSTIWTDEMREYWSKYNPMKSEEQRERMRNNNPMKNKEVALKMGAKKKRAVVINGVEFPGVIDAARTLKVDPSTISKWCKQGHDTYGKPCRYADEEQKKYTYKQPNTKSVRLGDTIYPSVKAAALSVGMLDSSPLCKALKNHRKYHGMECEYVNQQPSQ